MSVAPGLEAPAITDEQKINAATNEWGKEFTLGDRTFEIKDLPYFDYLKFIQLAKPVITAAASGITMKSEGGEIGLDFDPSSLDYDQLIDICGDNLPKMLQIICKQTEPKIKAEECANLARRPQRILEIVLLQVFHNKMIEEFAGFFKRLTGMVTALVPDVAKAAAPLGVSDQE